MTAPAEMVEAMARAMAADFDRQDGEGPREPFPNGGLSWSYVDQGEVDFGEVATAVIQALHDAGWVVVPKKFATNAVALQDAILATIALPRTIDLTSPRLKPRAMLSAGEG